MVEVSDKFVQLATENGRRVFCRITAGDSIYADDRIISFDFDDVIHPDWFTVGTTCANRFAFTVLYSGELSPGDTVKPFISFDGEEWCPLGVFYVARRYVRGKYASITCYDKMYFLDMPYVCSLYLPSDTESVLQDACSQAGISCDGFGESLKISSVPEDATVRDIIGYVAAINRGCGKFSRDGELIIKRFTAQPVFRLSVKNCMDYSRNMSPSRVTKVLCNTGKKQLESGSGGVLETLELYNPFMNRYRMDVLKTLLENFSFYGAEAEMQGMPFLESGDVILISESENEYYRVVLSELEYSYDGGLTAKISSRNRCFADAALHEDDLENAVQNLYISLDRSYIKQVNNENIGLSSTPVTLADFTFETPRKNTFAQLDVNFPLETEGTLDLTVYVNGESVRELPGISGGSSGAGLFHIYHLADMLPRGENRIQCTAASSTAAVISAGKLLATLIMQGAVVETDSFVLRANSSKTAVEYGSGAQEMKLLPPSSGAYGSDTHAGKLSFCSYGVKNGVQVPVIAVYKSFSIGAYQDNYTDSAIGYIDGVDLTDWSEIQISYSVCTNAGEALIASAYFSAGEKPQVVPGTPYDWSEWSLIKTCNQQDNVENPQITDIFTADISALTGIQRLNFGIYHGDKVFYNSVGIFIDEIKLVR